MKRIILFIFLLIGTLSSENIYSQKKSHQNKKKTSSVKKTSGVKKTKSKASTDDGEYYNGHKIITGPRGGRYYINSHGKKTYI